jgi:CHAT domain-containing protein
MQLRQITLRRQSAMLDFEDGQLPNAESELSKIIDELRAGSADGLFELCRSLLDRATVLSVANRWEEALDDLKECKVITEQLKPFNRRMVLVNVFQQQAKLFATPFTSVHNLSSAREALSQLTALGLNDWFTVQTVAELAYQERNWEAAAQGYREVAIELGSSGWARGVAACRLQSGRAFLEQNELEAAETDLNEALSFFEKHGPPDVLASAKSYTARLRLARGDAEEAWKLAEGALDLLEGGIRKFGALFDQQRFVLNKLVHYEYAFAIALATGGEKGIWRAWTIAERAKSFYLCQLVASENIELFEGVPPEKLSKLRELESRLDQIEARMAQSITDVRAEVEKELNKVSQAKEKLQESMMRANPRWGALKTPPRLDLRAEFKRLDPSWVPLSYFWQTQTEGALLHIFYAGKDRRPQHSTIDWSTNELEKLTQARARLRGIVMPIVEIFPAELVEKILPSEISAQLKTGHRLLISPHEHLRMLPLHALPISADKRLIDVCPVQYIPSMALLPSRRAGKGTENILLMGCEQDGFSSPPLKEVPDELERLNEVWSKGRYGKTVKCLLPRDSSPEESGFPLSKWIDFDVLHFACHGDFPEGRPFDAALRLGKDAVRTSEFFGVRLKATLVSLSACSLGRQTQQHSGIKLAGDEWVGLYLPLFYAGARGLVVSLWDANSEAAASFMKEFHRALSETGDLAGAFQKAMQSVAQTPEALWANWYLVGFPN